MPQAAVVATSSRSTPETASVAVIYPADRPDERRFFVGLAATAPLGTGVAVRFDVGLAMLAPDVALMLGVDVAGIVMWNEHMGAMLRTYAAPIALATGVRIRRGRLELAPRIGASTALRYATLREGDAWKLGFAFGVFVGAAATYRIAPGLQFLIGIDADIADVTTGRLVVGVRR